MKFIRAVNHPNQAIDFGENLMVSVGCETIECLREMDLRELIDSTWKHIIGGIEDREFLAGPWGESLRYRKVTQLGFLNNVHKMPLFSEPIRERD